MGYQAFATIPAVFSAESRLLKAVITSASSALFYSAAWVVAGVMPFAESTPSVIVRPEPTFTPPRVLAEAVGRV